MRLFKKTVLALSVTLMVAGCRHDEANQEQPGPGGEGLELPQAQLNSDWFKNGRQTVEAARKQKINNTPGAAKNIILFLGDGMSISTVTAARILAGQQLGMSGEENQLSFETMPFSGLVKTYNTNQQTPDSAGTMTALVTGVKTKAGFLSVGEDVARGDCAASLERPLVTSLELAESLGKSTGIISTARITHATPGATYAKVPERGWEYTAPEGCRDIAAQLVEMEVGDGIDVVMGGGRRNFLPSDITDLEGKNGRREDGRNLIDEWKSRYNDGVNNIAYVEDTSGFEAVDSASTDKLLGLFNSSHMEFEAARESDTAGEPSLTEMTAKGLELLQKNKKGYFLMVESGRIDHGHHGGNAHRALTDAVEFAKAIQYVMDNTSEKDTLIVVTADHSHVMTIAGYPTRGNPILGKVVSNNSSGEPESTYALAQDGLPYTTITYANGPGHSAHDDGSRTDLTSIDTEMLNYQQDALVPMGSETHAGEDVGVWARGPGAHLVSGTNEQSYLFHVMARAGGLLKQKGK